MTVPIVSKDANQIKITKQPVVVSSSNNENELIAGLDNYYEMSLKVQKDFGGPSIYFHRQAIMEQENNFLSE